MNMMAKNSKNVPLFCEYSCLVPHLDHTGLTAGDYVESVLQGRGTSELRPPPLSLPDLARSLLQPQHFFVERISGWLF